MQLNAKNRARTRVKQTAALSFAQALQSRKSFPKTLDNQLFFGLQKFNKHLCLLVALRWTLFQIKPIQCI